MKKIIMMMSLVAFSLIVSSAQATVIIGVGYENAQSNCNIAMGGVGVISDCSYNPNGTVTCDCEAASVPGGGSCIAIVGVGYEGAQSNCTIATNGAGSISNCSFNDNGTVTCSCCQ